jgi:hypothetical protein
LSGLIDIAGSDVLSIKPATYLLKTTSDIVVYKKHPGKALPPSIVSSELLVQRWFVPKLVAR